MILFWPQKFPSYEAKTIKFSKFLKRRKCCMFLVWAKSLKPRSSERELDDFGYETE